MWGLERSSTVQSSCKQIFFQLDLEADRSGSRSACSWTFIQLQICFQLNCTVTSSPPDDGVSFPPGSDSQEERGL